MRTKFEVAQVISRFKDSFYQQYTPCGQVRKVFSHLEECRTPALGGHVDACPECGVIRVSYNSCRDRHCPKCQGVEREVWVQNRMEDLLPVKYFHVVFTLPAALHSLSLANMSVVYSSLFRQAWNTLSQFALQKGVQTGMTAILHTWGSNLHYHPHIHCIVPEGGIDKDGNWSKISEVTSSNPFLFTVKGMSRMFRAKFMNALTQKIEIPPHIRKELFAKDWVVYCKKPFQGAEKVVKYLGRYSHRVAISNSRIKDISEKTVTFDYKDYKDAGKHKLLTLAAEEFLHRFSQHILPHGFVRIRHYGFMAAGNREKLRKIQLQMKVPQSPIKRKKKVWTEICKEKWPEFNVCIHCQQAQMVTVMIIKPTRPPPLIKRDCLESRYFIK